MVILGSMSLGGNLVPVGNLAQSTDLKRSAQKDLQDAQTQFPSFSFSSLPSVGRTEGNEGNRQQRRGI
jgi:predicted ATP-dependent Lon-type protease